MLRGRLNRFSFTPGRVLESGASWNRERRHLARPLRSDIDQKSEISREFPSR
ncbi:hypothetical protein F2P79_007172 [Pimephales promelas]|nr:hypothetical protein F2P79_007172 [Pimephales promelas]